ncbi:MAG: hypothetical protein QOH62_3573 [Solirubrobacteraceae bacterium]|jgi:hypothetical protein|nr:hypothetical protein [Solirubrobacteraceae bacterium]
MRRAIALALMLAAPATAHAGTITIKTLSNRADLISDGQALVGVHLPKGADHGGLEVMLGDRDVTGAFKHRDGNRVEGVIDGLALGVNELVATAPGATGAKLEITNHPNGGPVFSGPQPRPWHCQAGAVDAQCDQPAAYTYLYKSTDPSKPDLQPYDPANPATDVASTTTDEGKTVPFIVRQELGYQDRDEYKILTLYTPGQPWSRWRPQPQWNHKLVVTGGGGCGVTYGTGDAPLQDFSGTIPSLPGYTPSYVNALGEGFAVMSTALDNTGHNCNLVTEAESLIMAKERLIEDYGHVRYTIGTGCSGGSAVQNTVANAYPGAVYDGLVITCAYPDVLTGGTEFADYHMLRGYFENPSRWGTGIFWAPAQWGPVEGRPDPVNAIVSDEALFKTATNPVGTCVPGGQSYDPQTNPGGPRCSILDAMINVLGPRPASVWSPMEQRAGHGFAGQPFGNDGIQYGLGTLEKGLITADQFVDLNARVGGADIDINPTATRLAGDDSAVVNAYRSGLVNEMNNMSGVAIINHDGPDPGIAHDYAHSWWIRDRLDRAQGGHGNEVLWYGPTPLIGSPTWPTKALLAMDRWLAAVEADHSGVSRPKKIVEDRPADIKDKCLVSLCKRYIGTRYGTPRQVAGGSEFNDIVKCRLKPMRRASYPVTFTDAQWSALQHAFPDGACDWSKPGVGQQENIPWLTYQDGEGHVIYGGTPMVRAPRSVPLR